jgi:SpoVK/Ycf46/Vps4 family AAA+-type ATPase
VVIGATNRPWIIDKAAIRGGRFDTHIYVGLPDGDARKFIVEKAFRNDPRLLQGSDLTIPYMSERLEGFSGADITSICQKAKIQALKRAKVQN